MKCRRSDTRYEVGCLVIRQKLAIHGAWNVCNFSSLPTAVSSSAFVLFFRFSSPSPSSPFRFFSPYSLSSSSPSFHFSSLNVNMKVLQNKILYFAQLPEYSSPLRLCIRLIDFGINFFSILLLLLNVWFRNKADGTKTVNFSTVDIRCPFGILSL